MGMEPDSFALHNAGERYSALWFVEKLLKSVYHAVHRHVFVTDSGEEI